MLRTLGAVAIAGLVALALLPEGRTRPVVAPPLTYGEYLQQPATAAPVQIRVSRDRQLMIVTQGGREIGKAVILYGDDAHPTPTGQFHVLAKDAAYVSRAYDAPMPYALRLTADGVAIHAADVRESRATHGCIGVPLGFARWLYGLAGLGTMVEIK